MIRTCCNQPLRDLSRTRMAPSPRMCQNGPVEISPGGGMVYADGSNPSGRKAVGVRLPSRAPREHHSARNSGYPKSRRLPIIRQRLRFPVAADGKPDQSGSVCGFRQPMNGLPPASDRTRTNGSMLRPRVMKENRASADGAERPDCGSSSTGIQLPASISCAL